MPIRKLLFLALILAGCVARSSAQWTTAPHDSRNQTPPISVPAAKAHADSLVFAQNSVRIPLSKLVPKGNSVCYAIRSYNFESTDPSSGVTKLRDTTTCEPANNAQLTGATGFPAK